MKSLLLFLLLLSFTAQAQQAEEWITPFAHIEFENGMVHYFYVDISSMGHYRVLPIFYPADKMHLVRFIDNSLFDSDTIAYWKKHIWDIASGDNYLGACREDQIYFIRAFLLQIIWSSGNVADLPGVQAVDIIQNLCNNNDIQTQEYAKMTWSLFEDFKTVAETNRK